MRYLFLLLMIISTYVYFVPNIVNERTVFITTDFATGKGVGTGVILNDHEILTSRHVIKDGNKVVIRFTDGEEIEATVAYEDPKIDFAVLHVKKDFPWWKQSTLSCEVPQVKGQSYFTIGQMLGFLEWAYVPLTFSTSPPFEIEKLGTYFKVFQSQANHGNSGGGVFDHFGMQVGITAAIVQVNGFEIQDNKIMANGLTVNVGPTYVLSTKDVCPILEEHHIEFQHGYNINDLIATMHRGLNYVYYEVIQL